VPGRAWMRIGLAGLIGVLAVAMLARLPGWERELQQRRHSVTAFQPGDAISLSNDNLVDELVKLPLRDRLVKVGWDHSILTIDLQGSIPDSAWTDISHLIAFAYGELRNVRQLLIRVFQGRGEGRALLMAVETRKSEWTEQQLTSAAPSELWMDPDINSKLRLSITPAGKRWIANFAN
jgi:hypothetical protein